jgi:hypothetical protein
MLCATSQGARCNLRGDILRNRNCRENKNSGSSITGNQKQRQQHQGISHCHAAAGVGGAQQRLSGSALRIGAGIGPERVRGHAEQRRSRGGGGGGGSQDVYSIYMYTAFCFVAAVFFVGHGAIMLWLKRHDGGRERKEEEEQPPLHLIEFCIARPNSRSLLCCCLCVFKTGIRF